MKTDNPAGRLYEILTRAKAITGSGYKIWSEALDLPTGDKLSADDEFEIVNRIEQVRILVSEVEDSLRKVEGLDLDLNHYLNPLSKVRQALIPSALTVSNFEHRLSEISDSDMTILAICAVELSKRNPEPSVDERQLKELLSDIDSLFNEVKVASIPDVLKTFILRQLEYIRQAIQEYRIRGRKRLREALSRILGSILVDAEIIKNEQDKKEMKKFSRIFFTFVSLVEFASKTTPLIEPIAKVIGLLLPGEPKNIPPIISDKS